MKTKYYIGIILTLIISSLVLGLIYARFTYMPEESLKWEEEEKVYIQFRLTMGVLELFENGTVARLIHNRNNYFVYNVTIRIWYPYENSTYRGYTEVNYTGPDLIKPWGYWYFNQTNFQAYIEARAYAWRLVVG